jgi:secondary thiamine-phosphate synthase enzyme
MQESMESGISPPQQRSRPDGRPWRALACAWLGEEPAMEEFDVKTDRKNQIIDITARVLAIVRQSTVSEGICCVYTPHTTVAITINENADPNVCEDILEALAKLIPEGIWRHDRVDNNAAAHIKASLIGASEAIPVKDGRLVLGRWQAVMLVELDGPRERRVIVEVR